MGKLPAILLYDGDWYKDGVAGCSLAAQGLWLRMMFIGHNSERYGYLQVNNLPIPSDSIARRCGCTPEEYAAYLSELDRNGVPSRTPEGIIFSRRMVKDANERAQAKIRKQNERKNKSESRFSHAPVTPLSEDVNEEVKEVAVRLKLEEPAGDEDWERLCKAHPKPEYSYATQTRFFEAVNWKSERAHIGHKEASAYIVERAATYRELCGFPVGLHKWLYEKIFEQTNEAWSGNGTNQQSRTSAGRQGARNDSNRDKIARVLLANAGGDASPSSR